MCIYAYMYVWVGVMLMHIYQPVCMCEKAYIYECVCGIPTVQQIRKVTPNSQSGAGLSIKGNLRV